MSEKPAAMSVADQRREEDVAWRQDLRKDDVEWRQDSRDMDYAWRRESRALEEQWRIESRGMDYAWRRESRALDDQVRADTRETEFAWRRESRQIDQQYRHRESRLSNRRAALLAATQTLQPGSSVEEAFALAARFEEWINAKPTPLTPLEAPTHTQTRDHDT